jgi:glycosyltransferase involved in cell wall biosynthesis
MSFWGYERYPIRLKNKIIRKLAETLSTDFMCGGKYIRKYYGTKCKDKRIFIAGVEEIPSAKKLKGKKERIAFMGRIKADTNIEAYVHVMKILKEKYKLRIPLDVYGDGELRDKLEKFCKENKLNVRFLGFVDRSQRFLYKYKYVFSSPPQYATITNAMANKCLVFSICENEFKLETAKDVGSDKGLILIAKNPEDMARCFMNYYKKPKLYNKIIKSAYAFVTKNLMWDKIIDKFIQMYKENGIRIQ